MSSFGRFSFVELSRNRRKKKILLIRLRNDVMTSFAEKITRKTATEKSLKKIAEKQLRKFLEKISPSIN